MGIIDIINIQIAYLKAEYEKKDIKGFRDNCLKISGGIDELEKLIREIALEKLIRGFERDLKGRCKCKQ